MKELADLVLENKVLEYSENIILSSAITGGVTFEASSKPFIFYPIILASIVDGSVDENIDFDFEISFGDLTNPVSKPVFNLGQDKNEVLGVAVFSSNSGETIVTAQEKKANINYITPIIIKELGTNAGFFVKQGEKITFKFKSNGGTDNLNIGLNVQIVGSKI